MCKICKKSVEVTYSNTGIIFKYFGWNRFRSNIWIFDYLTQPYFSGTTGCTRSSAWLTSRTRRGGRKRDHLYTTSANFLAFSGPPPSSAFHATSPYWSYSELVRLSISPPALYWRHLWMVPKRNVITAVGHFVSWCVEIVLFAFLGSLITAGAVMHIILPVLRYYRVLLVLYYTLN